DVDRSLEELHEPGAADLGDLRQDCRLLLQAACGVVVDRHLEYPFGSVLLRLVGDEQTRGGRTGPETTAEAGAAGEQRAGQRVERIGLRLVGDIEECLR